MVYHVLDSKLHAQWRGRLAMGVRAKEDVGTERRTQRGEACGEIEVKRIVVWKYMSRDTAALDNSRSEACASCSVESLINLSMYIRSPDAILAPAALGHLSGSFPSC